MHTEMWEHPATRRNISLIEADGHRIIGPFSGELAGGDVGIGRVAEPEEIVEFAKTVLHRPLEGLTVLVTAGGTREALDPVRYLGNRSSGKMGHAIAAAAAQRGAHVELVTTSSLPAPPGANVHRVESAQEMLEAVEKIHPDIAVFAAAVADFRPAQAAQDKLSRSDGPPTLVLEPTPDILASVVARGDDIFVVGFAAETGGVERAIEKAKRKGVDLMVYNDVTAPGSGFGTDTNQVTLIEPDGTVDRWPQLSKAEVASRLMEIVANRLGR